MAAKKVTIEEKMSRIDVIIQALEQEDTTLQDSMKYYKEGVKLLKECDGMLDKVEKEIEELTKEQDDGE
ncbi:MAG: exodeoxyribonuclease VII small subunit [Lachnospiraceae bacterium]|nr:exodeoxyribonuclease VII small subunit [Lachnospiraceae bacterium]